MEHIGKIEKVLIRAPGSGFVMLGNSKNEPVVLELAKRFEDGATRGARLRHESFG